MSYHPRVSNPTKPTRKCPSCERELVDSSRNYATPDSIYCKDCDRHEAACHMTDKFSPKSITP